MCPACLKDFQRKNEELAEQERIQRERELEAFRQHQEREAAELEAAQREARLRAAIEAQERCREEFHSQWSQLAYWSGETAGVDTSHAAQRSDVVVTTADIDRPYDVVGPVYFQVSNKGIFSSPLKKLTTQYQEEIARLRASGQASPMKMDWGFLYGEWSVGQNDFDTAFYIAVQELRQRALRLKADGIVGMRQDIDLDTTNFSFFYLQIYGTAVRYR